MILTVDSIALFISILGVSFVLWNSIRSTLKDHREEIKEFMALFKADIDEHGNRIKSLHRRINYVERYLARRRNILSHGFRKKNNDDDEEPI